MIKKKVVLHDLILIVFLSRELFMTKHFWSCFVFLLQMSKLLLNHNTTSISIGQSIMVSLHIDSNSYEIVKT